MVWPPMLRRSCETGGMDDLPDRLRAAGTALLGLRGALVAGEPWPLSENWGHTPEAEWGPREVLGHVDEMLPYWVEELRRVVAGDGVTPVAFGRIATDQSRLDRIDADRRQAAGELVDSIDAGLQRTIDFVNGLSADELDRIGAHPSRGDITVAASLERFLVGHLEDHVEQLRATLGNDSPA